MTNWLKITVSFTVLLVIIGFLVRKQGAKGYDAAILQRQQQVLDRCFDLHEAMDGLKPDALQSDGKEIKEEVRKGLRSPGLDVDAREINLTDPMEVETRFQRLRRQLETSRATVQAMADFKGNPDLKQAALDWFDAYEQLTTHEYFFMVTLFKTPVNRLTDGDAQRFAQLVDEVVRRREQAATCYLEARRLFARVFKYKIDEP